jgi:hypothetical protein
MTPVTKYTALFIASLVVIALVIYKTSKSSFSKDRKIAVYIVTPLMPVVGIILFLIFRYKASES